MGSIIGVIFFHLHRGETSELKSADFHGFTCDYCYEERAEFNSRSPDVFVKCFSPAKSAGPPTSEDGD